MSVEDLRETLANIYCLLPRPYRPNCSKKTNKTRNAKLILEAGVAYIADFETNNVLTGLWALTEYAQPVSIAPIPTDESILGEEEQLMRVLARIDAALPPAYKTHEADAAEAVLNNGARYVTHFLRQCVEDSRSYMGFDAAPPSIVDDDDEDDYTEDEDDDVHRPEGRRLSQLEESQEIDRVVGEFDNWYRVSGGDSRDADKEETTGHAASAA